MTYLDEEILEKQESHEAAPNERIEREEASGFLLRIVATLPPRQQEVLQLKFQNDLSYEEISQITKLSVNHVGVLIQPRSRPCASGTPGPRVILFRSTHVSLHEYQSR